jgi:hypothetical protein
VVSIYILTIFRGGQIPDLLILISIQLGVRNNFQESLFNCIDFVISWLGNLPDRRNSTRGEETLAQLHI